MNTKKQLKRYFGSTTMLVFLFGEIRTNNEFNNTLENIKNSEKYISLKNSFIISTVIPQQHVPQALRNARTMKEKCRSLYHQMPFNHIPKKLLISIVLEATTQMNYFPPRYGLSKYYSPHMIICKKGINYKQHCQYAIGSAEQANNEPSQKNNSKNVGLHLPLTKQQNVWWS